MPNDRRIPGRPGTLPPSGTPPVNDPTPPAPKTRNPVTGTEVTGKLVHEGDKIFVLLGTKRIPIENGDLVAPIRTPQPDRKSGFVESNVSDDLKRAVAAAAENRDRLLAKEGVVDVRAGYLFRNGAITSTPAVVVAIRPMLGKPFDKSAIANELGIPADVGGVPVDLEIADPYQQLLSTGETEAAPLLRRRPQLLIDEIQATGLEAELLEAVPVITYEPPAHGDLSPVTGAMKVTCHVSPDAGWRVLKPFLEDTRNKLHLGMYDFTAPHIYRLARTMLKESDVNWQQVLGPKESLPTEDDVDSTKANDIKESSVVRGLKRVASDRFGNAFAHIGSGKTFASAYHIKVAVRDDRSFWLSSGNWQSSNQPDIDFFDENEDRQLIARYNREWHVVCENPTLAKRFQVFLDHDFETASTAEEAAIIPEPLPDLLVPVEELLEEERAAVGLEVFAPEKFTFTSDNPLTVQPILTPDNYLEVVLAFLRKKPRRKLYFQNQSLNPIKSPTAEFAELMKLLVKYSKDQDLDVRFIFRNIGPIRKKLESLQAAGFNMSRIRMQSGCHTKGIIVDSETILLGSHNITNQGVQVNRDASLLIRNQGIAQYYEKVFLHDWEKLSKETIREESVPVPIGGNEAAVLPSGDFLALPFSYFEEE
jgi:hypothetical protein